MAEHPAGGSHLSIGEVLALLLEEFPDVTISKIRFLESQGLIDPERTASGYRKFYDDDVELLRCILREQKENYLPLRVIKDRIDSGEIDPSGEQPRPRGIRNVGDLDGFGTDAERDAPVPPDDDRPTGAAALFVRTDPEPPATTEPEPTAPREAEPSGAAERGPDVHVDKDPVPDDAAPPTEPPPPAVLPGVLLNPDELCAMAGISAGQLAELERYGLLAADHGGVYADDAVEVAIICKRFLDIGVDSRHLRGWRVAADRESGLIEQVIQPLLRQRNPEARSAAIARMAQLEDLGGQLRAAMMRSALASHRGR